MTKNLDLSKVRVVVFDEADEIFYTEGNEAGIKAFMGNFQTLGIKPQCLFYSATLNEDIKYKIASSVHVDQYFEVPREALIIKGIKQFKMFFQDNAAKIKGLNKFLEKFGIVKSIIFCNSKKTADYIQERIEADF